MKKLFYFIVILSFLIFISFINLFLKLKSDINHILGINLIIGINLFILIGCLFIINIYFKKSNLNSSKNYRKDIKTVFANSFVASSIFSIIVACIVYAFFQNILEILSLGQGLIHYCLFVAKIWFISAPFIGLELTVFKYFDAIDYWKKPITLLRLKLLTFFIVSFLYYGSRKSNSFIYAKPVCDILFLIYYSKICFDVTLNKA